MELSVMTEPQIGGTYDQLLTLARWAEDNGLHSFARSDHYYSTRQPTPDATDAFATLAGLARETQSIRLAVLVTPLTFRHPAVVAKNAATIDQMSGGRLDLGVGTGWMEAEHTAFGLPFPSDPERFARLEEGVGYLKAAFGTGHGSYSGEYYRLDATVEPTPTDVRLILGGSGPRRTPGLAGREADEYNCLICPVDQVAARVEVMREAAGGRKVTASVMGPVLVGRDASEYRQNLADAAAVRDTTPEALEARYEKAGIIVGDSARVADSVAALAEAGVDRIYVQWLDPADVDGLARSIEVIRGS